MSIVTVGRVRLLITALVTAASVSTGVSACGPQSSPAAGAASSPAAGSAAPSSSAATASAASTASAAAASGAGAVAGINVCALVSPAQASAINKVSYGAGTPKQVTAGWEQCQYPNKGGADPVDIQPLSIDVIAIAGCFDQLKATVGPTTAISGLGDAAIGYAIGLLVRTGSTCVQVQGLTHAELNGDHSRDEAIAKIVLAGLH
ncbi:MAG TPA: hypothetical protein VMI73_28285 [Trebonia sp.]|nr:hypothetical protein [Trebonia sp.]